MPSINNKPFAKFLRGRTLFMRRFRAITKLLHEIRQLANSQEGSIVGSNEVFFLRKKEINGKLKII